METGALIIPFDGKKVCSACGQEKLSADFHRVYRGSDKRQYHCKACHADRVKKNYPKTQEQRRAAYKRHKEKNPLAWKNYQLKRDYGITLDMFYEMVKSQNGLCAICGDILRDRNLKNDQRASVVDHCHKTGFVRGILCNPCNAGIGMLRESKEIILKAVAYLERAK